MTKGKYCLDNNYINLKIKRKSIYKITLKKELFLQYLIAKFYSEYYNK